MEADGMKKQACVIESEPINNCIIDISDNLEDCIYAKKYNRKEDCPYWREIESGLSTMESEMLAMLERLEWSGEADVMDERMTFCPVCEVGYDRHDDGCDLGNLLHRIRGEQ
jgi:hypothetical protein